MAGRGLRGGEASVAVHWPKRSRCAPTIDDAPICGAVRLEKDTLRRRPLERALSISATSFSYGRCLSHCANGREVLFRHLATGNSTPEWSNDERTFREPFCNRNEQFPFSRKLEKTAHRCVRLVEEPIIATLQEQASFDRRPRGFLWNLLETPARRRQSGFGSTFTDLLAISLRIERVNPANLTLTARVRATAASVTGVGTLQTPPGPRRRMIRFRIESPLPSSVTAATPNRIHPPLCGVESLAKKQNLAIYSPPMRAN